MPVRVAPVTDVCEAFATWGEVTGEKRWPTQLEAWKSNLLYRLIYLGEPLRTEECPIHKGHWSGCRWGDMVVPNPDGGVKIVEGYCDCQKVIYEGEVGYNSNVTGWLLAGNPPVTARCGARTIEGQPEPNLVRVCTLTAGHTGTKDWKHEYSEWFDYRNPPAEYGGDLGIAPAPLNLPSRILQSQDGYTMWVPVSTMLAEQMRGTWSEAVQFRIEDGQLIMRRAVDAPRPD